MKSFEYFLQKGDVRKVSKNGALAKSLIDDMEERIKNAFEIGEDYKKLVFESVYDALRSFCDAILAAKGYKSYSHEASIIYLAKCGFDVVAINDLDNFRYKRNGSKYYGAKIDLEDAKKIKEFYKTHKSKIYDLIREFDLNVG